MAYQIECVVSEVVLGKDILFSFEPTSKYHVKWGQGWMENKLRFARDKLISKGK